MKVFNFVTLYYNEKGNEDVGVYSVSGSNKFFAINQLKKDLDSRGKIYKKCSEIDEIEKVSIEVKWSDAKKLRFTELFKIGLERGSNISINQAILFAYKNMFDPLIYLIFIRLGKGEKLSDIISEYPNVFDGFYCNIIRGYFDKSGDQAEGLDELINFYKKRLEFRGKVLSSSVMSLVSILVAIVSAFILDYASYPNLKLQYMGYPLPSSVELIHSVVAFTKESFFVIFLVYLVIYKASSALDFSRYKVWWGRLSLEIPIWGKIQKIDAETLFINMYAAMDQAHLTQTQILQIIADSMTNEYIRGVILALKNDIYNLGEDMGVLMDEKYRFFSEDVTITFKSDNIKKELVKLRNSYGKISEKNLDKSVKMLSTILMFLSLALGGFIVVSFMMGTMGVNDIIMKVSREGM